MKTFDRLLVLALILAHTTLLATPSPTVRLAYVQQKQKGEMVGLNDTLTILVCKDEFDAWAASQTPVPTLKLFFDGQMVKGIDPTTGTAIGGASRDPQIDANPVKCGSTTTSNNGNFERSSAVNSNSFRAFTYFLNPGVTTNPEAKDQWLQLLARPWQRQNMKVSVSLGLENSVPWESEASLQFQRIHSGWLAGWAALFLAAIGIFVRYARTSNILRDSGPELQATVPGTPAPRKSYSLARTQMAVWTFLIAGALALIFMVTWNENTLSPGVLGLIGISYTTTLLAAVADGPSQAGPTQGFFSDLLSDGNGASIHRYQMILFTLILAIIFVVKTANSLVIPEFDPILLGLMGISSGTYIGFKFNGQ